MLDDPNVSRRHAELRRSAQRRLAVADLGSTNGIKVNGRRSTPPGSRPGDEVTIGTTRFTFDIEQ